MRQGWRWFGPDDPTPLAWVRQAGATDVVTALHDMPNGTAWPEAAIARRRDEVAAAGLSWTVVESVPVTEAIKTGARGAKEDLAAYAATLRALGAAGIRTVCYNFMPVLDWTRSDLTYALPDGSLALRFDAVAVAAFDLCLLQRPGAEADWPEDVIDEARARFAGMGQSDRDALTGTVLAGLPGAEEHWTLDAFRAALAAYDGMGPDDLRGTLAAFLEAVTPAAEEAGVRLVLHPDDPPRGLFGLPRVVSTAEDYAWIFDRVPSAASGMTFCVGSLGARADNDLPAMVDRFAERIGFVHLRSVTREDDRGSFHEAAHLEGDQPMVEILRRLRAVERARGVDLPMRPDHGHRILDDQAKAGGLPGYSAIGRLKGLAELRGVLAALG